MELRECSIHRSYFPREANITTIQLHGFCDASEVVYTGVVYLRGIDVKEAVRTSLVVAKTKVATIKRITIPRLELCGALIVARLLKHTATVLKIRKGTYTRGPIVVWSWVAARVLGFKLRGKPGVEILNLCPQILGTRPAG